MITTNLNKPARQWYDLPVPAAAGVIIFILYIIAGLVWQLRSAPSVAIQPTPPLPIIIIASPQIEGPRPTAVPAAQIAAVVPGLRRAVVAYAAPDATTALGAIEQGRAYTVLARYGAEWLQADVAGSGVVWLRSSEVLDLPADIADLKPTDAPVIVERPIYVAAPPAYAPELAAPTPAPESYAVANEPPPACSTERQCALQRRLANEHVNP